MTDPLQLVSAPRRRAILRLIWDTEQSAGEIHRAMGDVTFGAVSQHLRLLQAGGVVSCREQGRQRIYAARKEALGPLRAYLESMWSSALDQLRLRAEMEESRRGPRQRRPVAVQAKEPRQTEQAKPARARRYR